MSKKYFFIFFSVSLFTFLSNNLYAKSLLGKDTSNIVFTSPRPLIEKNDLSQIKLNSVGLELLLSGSGVGIGCQLERILSKNYNLNYGFFFSGKRNTDEIEYWNYEGRNFSIPNKVNRLFTLPFNCGIQRAIQFVDLAQSFRPFVGVAAMPMLIWQLPYKADFFNEVKDAKLHFRAGGSIYIGANFGDFNTALISFKIKYNFVPWGGDGIESIRDFPIKNMGGVFLSLTIGKFF